MCVRKIGIGNGAVFSNKPRNFRANGLQSHLTLFERYTLMVRNKKDWLLPCLGLVAGNTWSFSLAYYCCCWSCLCCPRCPHRRRGAVVVVAANLTLDRFACFVTILCFSLFSSATRSER